MASFSILISRLCACGDQDAYCAPSFSPPRQYRVPDDRGSRRQESQHAVSDRFHRPRQSQQKQKVACCRARQGNTATQRVRQGKTAAAGWHRHAGLREQEDGHADLLERHLLRQNNIDLHHVSARDDSVLVSQVLEPFWLPTSHQSGTLAPCPPAGSARRGAPPSTPAVQSALGKRSAPPMPLFALQADRKPGKLNRCGHSSHAERYPCQR